jgi:hypothetical protein
MDGFVGGLLCDEALEFRLTVARTRSSSDLFFAIGIIGWKASGRNEITNFLGMSASLLILLLFSILERGL